MAHEPMDPTPRPDPPGGGRLAAGVSAGGVVTAVPEPSGLPLTPGGSVFRADDTSTRLRQAYAAAPDDDLARAAYAQCLLRDGVVPPRPTTRSGPGSTSASCRG